MSTRSILNNQLHGQKVAIEPDPEPIGHGKLDIAYTDARGRIVVVDSFSYCDERVGLDDVIVGGSFAGASTTSTLLPLGVKAIIGHDAGIGKAKAGTSGFSLCDQFGIPMAAVAGHTATLSNGNSLLNGTVSGVNETGRHFGVRSGSPEWPNREPR